MTEPDFDLPGYVDGMRPHADTLSSTSSDLEKEQQAAEKAFAHALANWEGGGRRELYRNASAGIQGELYLLSAATTSVADFVDAYFGAATSAHDAMDQEDTFWSNKWLLEKDDPSEAVQEGLRKARHNAIVASDKIRADLRKMAHLVAQDIDHATNLLVPGGAKLSPHDIAQRITELLHMAPGSKVGDVTGLLETAASAVPPGSATATGGFKLDKFLAQVNDTVQNAATLGGEGWALENLLVYYTTAAGAAKRTDELYASIVGTSFADFRAGRLTAAEHVASILRYVEKQPEMLKDLEAKNSQLLADVRSGGRLPPGLARFLAVTNMAGNIYTLTHLDEAGENPTEREVIKWATIANTLGISTRALALIAGANSGDAIPVYGEAVATVSAVVLLGCFAYENGPEVVESVKKGFVDGLKSWVFYHMRYGG